MTEPETDQSSGTPSNGGHYLTRGALTFSFFLLLVMAFVCLVGAAIYLYSFQSHLDEISSSINSTQSSLALPVSLAQQEVKALSIAYVRRIELLSTGVFVGLSFGFLGFALLVIGVRGDISAEGSKGPFTVKFSHLSPGVLVIIAATVLIGVSTTRSLPLNMHSNSGTQNPQQPLDHRPSQPEANRPTQAEPNSPKQLGKTRLRHGEQNRPAPEMQHQQDADASAQANSPEVQGIASSSSDPWVAANAVADRAFKLLASEALAKTVEEKHALWLQRTAVFRQAEVAFRSWAYGDGQKYVQAGGAPALKMAFRGALYAEYAGDYEDARNLYSDCQRSAALQDQSAKWNDASISSLLAAHQHIALITWTNYRHLSDLNAQQQVSSNGFGSSSNGASFAGESFGGEIAQSVTDFIRINEIAYKKIHDLEVQSAEWADPGRNAAGIKARAMGPDLVNDHSLPQ